MENGQIYCKNSWIYFIKKFNFIDMWASTMNKKIFCVEFLFHISPVWWSNKLVIKKPDFLKWASFLLCNVLVSAFLHRLILNMHVISLKRSNILVNCVDLHFQTFHCWKIYMQTHIREQPIHLWNVWIWIFNYFMFEEL